MNRNIGITILLFIILVLIIVLPEVSKQTSLFFFLVGVILASNIKKVGD